MFLIPPLAGFIILDASDGRLEKSPIVDLHGSRYRPPLEGFERLHNIGPIWKVPSGSGSTAHTTIAALFIEAIFFLSSLPLSLVAQHYLLNSSRTTFWLPSFVLQIALQ